MKKSMILLMVILIVGCTPKPIPLPTPDVNSLSTQIAGTIIAGAIQTQQANVPTSTAQSIKTIFPTQPSSTPSLPNPDLEIITGRDYVTYDYLHVIGEIKNNTNNWFTFVKVIATYYDKDGTVLGTDFTYIDLEDLAPNSTGVFDVISDVGGMAYSVASYKLQVQGDESNSIPYLDLQILVGREYNEYGYYHITGEINNVGQYDCEYTKIIGGLYDSEGKIINVDFTYTDLDILPKGQSTSFDLIFSDLAEPYSSYKLWVECNPVR